MCGLVIVKKKDGKTTGQRVYEVYNKQRLRGTAGYGYISINSGVITDITRGTTEIDISAKLKKDTSDLILFHHRKPTSTQNTIGTTHPIFVSNDELVYDYYFAHNGVITNHVLRKGQQERLGYKYVTEFVEHTEIVYKNVELREHLGGDEVCKYNDSESLAIDFVRYIEGLEKRINSVGGAAFWCVALRKGTDIVEKIYYGHNFGRELKRKTSKGWNVISSETGSPIDEMKIYVMDSCGNDIEVLDLEMDDAKPVQHTYYGAGYHQKYNNVSVVDEQKYKDILENAYYTLNDIEFIGAPMSMFTQTIYHGQTVYVPKQYAGIGTLERKPYIDTEKKQNMLLDDIKYEEDINDTLEDLALEYVTLEEQLESIPNTYYNREQRKDIEIEMDIVMEQLAALCSTDEECEEVLNRVRNLVIYQS